MFCYCATFGWQKWFKSFQMADWGQSRLNNSYHGFRWHCDTRARASAATTLTWFHNSDVILSKKKITSLKIVYPTVYSGAGQRKYQSSVSLAFVRRDSLVTGKFPAQGASNTENASTWWRHHISCNLPLSAPDGLKRKWRICRWIYMVL